MNTFDVVLTLIKNNPITWIWSFAEPTQMPEKNIAFRVNTIIHRGIVMIIYDEIKENFDILLIDNNKNVINTISDVHISQIVNEIHNAIFGMPKETFEIEMCRCSLN